MSTTPITLTIKHPFDSGLYVGGFLHLWAMYVRGFNSKEHCQKSLRGRLSEHVTTRFTKANTHFVFNEIATFDSLYICGVAKGAVLERKKNNLHLALEPKAGGVVVEWKLQWLLAPCRKCSHTPDS